jgi:Group II intron, maturase-specific domain/Reverse transcriptase (RNA-dependent DNA polymerase)
MRFEHAGRYKCIAGVAAPCPPPVRAVTIPKKSGGDRILGVPTVADRVAQMVVMRVIEPNLDPVFLADSYAYRPAKSALDAVGVTRKRCWKYDWVVEFDIKGLFDNIDHVLLLRAVRKHVTCKWALLYIERWVKAPMMQEDGNRKGTYPNVKFDFLGYGFRPRLVKSVRNNRLFCGFTPAVSVSALKAMRATIRELNIRVQTQQSLNDIAELLNPLLRGWIEYYGRYAPSALRPLLRYVNLTLVAWAMRKFKRFVGHKVRASQFLIKIAGDHAHLFVHWHLGMTGTFI